MLSETYRQRLNSLFSDIERLAANPAGETAAIRQELDELRRRLCELESNFSNIESCATRQEETPAPTIVKEDREEKKRLLAPILYEKERIGYAYTDDGVRALQDEMTVLPDATDAVIAPLTVDGQTIGKMQIEPASERSWTNEETELLQAVAQQAS